MLERVEVGEIGYCHRPLGLPACHDELGAFPVHRHAFGLGTVHDSCLARRRGLRAGTFDQDGKPAEELWQSGPGHSGDLEVDPGADRVVASLHRCGRRPATDLFRAPVRSRADYDHRTLEQIGAVPPQLF